MSGDEKSQEGVWGPPRRGVAGKTGTHQIVFKNGAVVTLPKTKLSFTQPGNFPKFAATMGHGGDQRVSWGGDGKEIDPADIVAIFRIDEDLNS